MHHRAAIAATVAAFAVPALAASSCHRSTGVEVTIELMVECRDGAALGPLDVESLRLDVAPCGALPGSCSVTSPDQFLTGGGGQVVYVEAADLSPLDPLEVLVENVDGIPETWLRIFASAMAPTGEFVATGWLDVYVDQAGLLRPADPLVLVPASCGDALPAPDYDGDGFVGAEADCDGFNPFVNVGAPEACTNGIDDDCDGVADLLDTDCFDPDADGDGICAAGIAEAVAMTVGGAIPDVLRTACMDRFTDCDDTNVLVGEHCPCDSDSDGFCSEPFICPHSIDWGLSIVCAPGGDCCNDVTVAESCGDIFPGQAESCDGIDNDCDGYADKDAPGVASCIDDLSGMCAPGLFCPGEPLDGAGTCHDLGYAGLTVPDNACSALELFCTNASNGAPGILACPGTTITITATTSTQPVATTACTITPIEPSLPLVPVVSSPAGGSGTGPACATFAVDVTVPATVFAPFLYSFYVQVEESGTAGTAATVFRFDVWVDPLVCGGGTPLYSCDAG